MTVFLDPADLGGVASDLGRVASEARRNAGRLSDIGLSLQNAIAPTMSNRKAIRTAAALARLTGDILPSC